MLHKCEERAQLRMYGLQDVLLRTSIVLGMVAAVVTILYFTPTPGKETLSTYVKNIDLFLVLVYFALFVYA